MTSVLEGDDTEALRALLGAARIAEASLSLSRLSPLLDHADLDIVKGAKRYLAYVNSAASRSMLFERFPDDLLLVGPNSTFEPADETTYEAELRARIRADRTISDIYALVEIEADGEALTLVIIEARGNDAMLFRPKQYRDERMPTDLRRPLRATEFRDFLNFLAKHEIDDLPPLYTEKNSNLSDYEFIHLTQRGGRTLFMTAPNLHAPASPYQRLVDIMDIIR